MRVERITDYFEVGLPVLHMPSKNINGAFLHAMSDTESVVISISKEKFNDADNELDYLMNAPIEMGAYEKNNHLLLLVKIGSIENLYIYPLPLNPVQGVNEGTVNAWVESRFIVICFIEGKEELTFKGIRVQGIPDDIREHVMYHWRYCFDHESGYSLKYLNFTLSALEMDPAELWKRGRTLGELED